MSLPLVLIISFVFYALITSVSFGAMYADTFPQGNLWFARFRVYFTPVDGLDQTGD